MKKIKKICMLSIAAFFLLGGLNAFATEHSPIVDTTRDSIIYVSYVYNAYGVAISSTTVTDTTTITVSEETDDVTGEVTTTTSRTVNRSTAISTWRGGSLKIDSVSGDSRTEGSDGSFSDSSSWTNYEYNSNGQLVSATGGSDTEGNRGVDDNGEPIGSFSSTTTNTYSIRNGQALSERSQTTGTNYGSDGTKTSEFTNTTYNSYELIGGSWQLMESANRNRTTGTDGSWENVIKTTTYQRDANGVLVGVSQELVDGRRAVVDGNGGTTIEKMIGYEATFEFDTKVGWYLASEDWVWVDEAAYYNAVEELGAAGLPTDDATIVAYIILKKAQANGWLEDSSWDAGNGEYGLNFSAIDGDGMAIHHAMDYFGIRGNDQGEFAYTIGDGNIAEYISNFLN